MSTVCTSCGAENTGSIYCPACGEAVGATTPKTSHDLETQSASTETAELATNRFEESSDQTSSSKKGKKFLALGIALILFISGGLGVFWFASSSSDVFTVNGVGYSIEELDALTAALVEVGQLTETNGSFPKEDLMPIIRVLIRHEAYLQFIKKYDIKETSANRKMVTEQAAADQSFPTYPKNLQDILIDISLAELTVSEMKTPAISTIEKLYNSSPSSSGVLCLSHILVKTKAQADAALAQIKAGADFAAVAKKKSIEPDAKESGGALTNGEEPCIALPLLQDNFDSDFMVGAVAAKAGVPSQPVKSSFGWHIILSHPYNEVKESVKNVLSEDSGSALLAGFLTSSDVTLNPTYGTWNSAAAKIS